jgi:hypothetical protein
VPIPPHPTSTTRTASIIPSICLLAGRVRHYRLRDACQNHSQGPPEPCYWHKLNADQRPQRADPRLVIETGIRADSERFIPMLDRHIAFIRTLRAGPRLGAVQELGLELKNLSR